jgi:FAD:protein FMN transferase
MGTDCVLHLYAAERADAERIAEAAVSEVLRIECRYSRYRSDSDLAAINRVAEQGGSIEVDCETAGLLDYAFAAYEKSEGLFDISSGLLRKAWDFKSSQIADQDALDALLPRVGLDKVIWQTPRLNFTVSGMELDFGGLGKEYAADRAAELCLAHGAAHGVVDLGGDIRVIGPHPGGEAWQIGIRHPRCPNAIMATASLERGSIATSGDYQRCIQINGERYAHLLHPKSGWPVRGLCSVTAMSDRCLVAGSICTIAMLKRLDGIAWLRNLGVDHIWRDEEGRQGWIGSCIAEKDSLQCAAIGF